MKTTETTTTTKVKTIDINCLEWFDKVNGNSYFAGTVTVNHGMPDAKEFKMPFQYGYGDSYRHAALNTLIKEGLIDTDKEYKLRDQGIVIRGNIQRGCKKRELKDF